MINIRRAEDRGPSDLGWLKSKHTFSFGHYYDPNNMGFETLRVINEDRVKPGTGFGTHRHDNMEIISYVLDGALEHKDSMGNGSVIRPGEVQRLSAGSGMSHSEYNHSNEDEVHFLQIWFLPEKTGINPSYEQKDFAVEDKRGKFLLVASKDGREKSVSLNQDMDMSVALLDDQETTEYSVKDDRAVWIHVARGNVSINGEELFAGDGASLNGKQILSFDKADSAEVIIFDMKAEKY